MRCNVCVVSLTLGPQGVIKVLTQTNRCDDLSPQGYLISG